MKFCAKINGFWIVTDTVVLHACSTLQKTPKDKKASLVIHGLVDKVFDILLWLLEISASLHFFLLGNNEVRNKMIFYGQFLVVFNADVGLET